jgi:predicted TIM-barrel fold metal-dependent hydrolase
MRYVDAHTHLWFPSAIEGELRERIYAQAGRQLASLTVRDVVEEMDELDLEFAVIMAYPSRRVWGTREDFALKIIDAVREYGSRFAVFGGVEPLALSVEGAADWLARQYEGGVSGFKVHPPHMWVKPNAYREEEGAVKQLEAVYQFAEDHGLPVTIHSGTSLFPAARNKYGDPVFVDDVAVDFPRLKIFLAHMGRPNWVPTAFQLVRIRSNVYAELSGIPPKRLLDYVPRIEEVSDKALYGSDYGGPGVKSLGQNLTDFLSLPISVDAKNKMGGANAARLVRTLER